MLLNYDPMSQYRDLFAQNKAATIPGSGVVGMLGNQQAAAKEEQWAQEAQEIAQYGRVLSPFERFSTTLPQSDSPADVQSTLAGVMGSTWGGGVAANVLENPLQAASSVFNPRRPQGLIPLTTYHGSPHRINNVDEANPMGKFDMARIGTGEGNQAYGHGIYLAQKPGTAEHYAVAMPLFDGKPINMRHVNDRYSPEGRAMSAMWDTDGHYSNARKALIDQKNALEGAREVLPSSYARPSSKAITAQTEKIDEALSWLEQNKSRFTKPESHFYTVDLPDEHIEKMLDWDAPLSEQPEAVRAALEKANLYDFDADKAGRTAQDLQSRIDAGELVKRKAWWMPQGKRWQDLTGEDVIKHVKGMSDSNGKVIRVEEYLNNLGIPGIRYFDGGSRAAGEGTRNFVVFDPDITKIEKRESRGLLYE